MGVITHVYSVLYWVLIADVGCKTLQFIIFNNLYILVYASTQIFFFCFCFCSFCKLTFILVWISFMREGLFVGLHNLSSSRSHSWFVSHVNCSHQTLWKKITRDPPLVWILKPVKNIEITTIPIIIMCTFCWFVSHLTANSSCDTIIDLWYNNSAVQSIGFLSGC